MDFRGAFLVFSHNPTFQFIKHLVLVQKVPTFVFRKIRKFHVRKRTGVIFILFANIIMLAHILMPHHNHYLVEESCQIACHVEDSPTGVCPHNDMQRFSPETDCNENHHQGLYFEDCHLEDIHIRYDENNLITESGHADYQPITLAQTEILIISEPEVELRHDEIKPYLLANYKTDFVRITGMRAPPYC